MLAHDALVAGSSDVIVAGGMESMTQAPYLLPKARAGYRMGHQQVIDHMFLDGLEDAYDKGRLMGTFAEECADKYRVHARGAGRVRAGVARARARRQRGRHLRLGDRAGHRDRQERRRRRRPRRAAGEGERRQDPDAEAGIPQGRHGDRGQLELDFRWRRGAGADAPLHGRGAPMQAAGGDRRRTRRMRRSRASSPPRRSARSPSCFEKTGWTHVATSTSSRSTRRSRW